MAGLDLPFPAEAAAESRSSHMPPEIPAASVPGLPGTMHAGRLVCVCYPECRYNVCLPLTEGAGGRNRGRERGQRWDFTDSIFTHQTELFPVSTWRNSHSHHFIPSVSIFLCVGSPSPPFPFFPFSMSNLNRPPPRCVSASTFHPCPTSVCLHALSPKHTSKQ